MECPYCKQEMVRGYIYGDRYQLKWLPEDKKLLLGIWAEGGIALGEKGMLSRPKVEAFVCKSCNKAVMDI